MWRRLRRVQLSVPRRLPTASCRCSGRHRASGFVEEADRMERGEGAASLSDRLLDEICLIGPIEKRLADYRAAGVDMPILMAPIGVDGARAVINAFQRPTDAALPQAAVARNQGG